MQEIAFDSRDDVKMYIIHHHMGRRNLSHFRRIELALKLEHVIEEKAQANQSAGGGSVRQKAAQPIKTREEIAKLAETSHDTLFKVKKVLEKADSSDIERLRNGQAKINSVYKKLEEQEAKENVKDEKIDPQEKKIQRCINAIVANMLKLEKFKENLPDLLMEQARSKISPLVNRLFDSKMEEIK